MYDLDEHVKRHIKESGGIGYSNTIDPMVSYAVFYMALPSKKIIYLLYTSSM